MKLVCNVSVGNRLLPGLAINTKRKHVKSTLALCKHPKSNEFCIILFTNQNKNGTKYAIKENIKQVLTRFVNEGKATIQFNTPPHDLYVQADIIQLKGFLHLFKRALENKIAANELTYSSMAVTPVSTKDIAPKKLVIRKRSDYPVKGFPRTLETLIINDIDRCALDRGILQLTKLKVLDLSGNIIEYLPEEFNKLPNLKELNLSHNNFGKGTLKQWSWLGGFLSNTLVMLDLSNNNLKAIPNQIIKLHNLNILHINHNNISELPSGIGNMRQLKVFSAAYNLLTALPGSVKKLRLNSIDLSHNDFDTSSENRPVASVPKTLTVCSLKEYSGRKVLNARIPYPPGSLPRTVIDFLDYAKYCVCGKACFEVYIRHHHWILLSNITLSSSVSHDAVSYVPMDCYFCGFRCFNSANLSRNRNPIIR